ncbi:MAG: hypothetical protein IJ802_02240 [Kiritimatiellae bacterium]|nr:hypothetical protein [Kiritimatiellia bacterium]
MKKSILTATCAVAIVATTMPSYAWGPPPPPPRYHHHHHHHHGRDGLAIGAGILGAGLLANTIYNATKPTETVVVQQPVVVPQQVVAPQPVVVQQQPVVVQQPQVTTRTRQGWVEGQYVEKPDGAGNIVRVWQPGHYETITEQVPVY